MSSILLLSATTKQSSSSSLLLPLLLGAFLLFYFLVLRPRQKQAAAKRQGGSELSVGDEIITIGGVRGVVVAVDNDLVTIATGQMPGDELRAGQVTHITFIRKAIGQVIPPPVEPGSDAEGAEGTPDDRPTDETGPVEEP